MAFKLSAPGETIRMRLENIASSTLEYAELAQAALTEINRLEGSHLGAMEVMQCLLDGALEREQWLRDNLEKPSGPAFNWGRPCAKCGEPVYPPTNRYMKAASSLGDRIWHGDCFPPEGVSGTFTISV